MDFRLFIDSSLISLDGLVKMKTQPLGMLKSLIVITDWISFADSDKPTDLRWEYRNETVKAVKNSCTIFIPVDFSRLLLYKHSYLLFNGLGIYWTKFSLKKNIMTTDLRYLTGLVIPEQKWLDNHFNTEPFVFPSFQEFMIASENLLEFSFKTLQPLEEYPTPSRKAFALGKMMTQILLPLKEPLVMLREAVEKYEEFYYDPLPMRVLMSEFFNKIFVNELTIEMTDAQYEEDIPGIRRIKPNLLEIFPKQWSNEAYLKGLRQQVCKISEDFTSIGIPLIFHSH